MQKQPGCAPLVSTTSQKCAVVPRWARIQGSHIFQTLSALPATRIYVSDVARSIGGICIESYYALPDLKRQPSLNKVTFVDKCDRSDALQANTTHGYSTQ